MLHVKQVLFVCLFLYLILNFINTNLVNIKKKSEDKNQCT